MALDKDTTALILLGASEFPSTRLTSSTAFLNSKERFKDFFRSDDLILDDSKVLDLFDTDESPDRVDASLSEFIAATKPNITDLILYYVGHGCFDTKMGYLLAMRSSRESNMGISSIVLKSLAGTLVKEARNLRLLIILDCCFSGEAAKDFMASPADVMERHVKGDFPTKGVMLLCSTSKDLPSLMVPTRGITMFTEGLLEALKRGSVTVQDKYLTIRQLGSLTFDCIRELNVDNDVRPEVHTPVMPAGDIADIPYFLNRAHRNIHKAYDIVAKRDDVKSRIIVNDLEGLKKALMDFIDSFDTRRKYELDVTLLASDINDLLELKPDPYSEKYQQYKAGRRKIYETVLNWMRDIMEGYPNG